MDAVKLQSQEFSTQRSYSSTPVLQLIGVSKAFGSFVAVHKVDLDVYEGEFLTLVGPSGSGKTTLLRMLAGMEVPSQGNIILRGNRINDLPPNLRPTCLVFQSLALFPHKTVGENIEFPLKVRGVGAPERRRRALELMATVHLPENYYRRNVMHCSGGEKQRVALARALAFDPEVLLFDEPLSAIDYRLKKVLQKELKELHQATRKTFVYVTHSLEEAMVMSDRIAVMHQGRLIQVGSPEEIYERPANRFVAEFMGDVNIIRVKRREKDLIWSGEDVDGSFCVLPPPGEPDICSAYIVIRPERLRVLRPHETADNILIGEIHNRYDLGSRIQYQVRVGEKMMLVEVSRSQASSLSLQMEVTLGWNASDAFTVVS
ncbi:MULTISPECIES: ABC transporter ATP-binding protein [unclassified Synechococcus]|jgi:spermidine/putrescine transport system ATP-binding protein|uniref:ABC transporter ATP-binding protein n=1 Tax=unclassified Synechococcus TaxID=2626047 RepID=UPI000C180B0E|nr:MULTISPECIES: ABC transporter ATP-binding protein [unclassified Synechococcus]